MYVEGARKNDLIFISHDTAPYVVDSEQASKHDVSKLKEIFLFNLIFIYPITFIGETGKMWWDYYLECAIWWPVNPEGRCFHMEITHIAAHVAQILIERGDDYTDPEKVFQAIYEVDFIGCSGRV